MVTRIYEGEDIASRPLIPAMIKDIGIEDEEVAEATSKWAEQLIVEADGLNMEALQDHCCGYHNGYMDALRAHGLR